MCICRTPLRVSAQDLRLAHKLHEQAVPLSLVESALLLASLRRLVRPADLPPLSPIRSLAYFQPVIAEIQQQPLPEAISITRASNCKASARSSRRTFQKIRFLVIANRFWPCMMRACPEPDATAITRNVQLVVHESPDHLIPHFLQGRV